MKVFLFGDIHLGYYSIKEVDDASKQVWNWVFENSKNVDAVIFLGDRFRSRDPEGALRDNADRMFVELSKVVPIYAIIGNHDMYYKFGSMENNYGVLDKWENIYVIKDRVNIELGGKKCEFVPYGVEPSGEGDYLFTHEEIEGMTAFTSNRIRLSSIKGYTKVYSGHIHRRMIKKNVTYIGCPYQQNFGDDSVTGGLILDLVTGKEEWINGYGPKFITGLQGNLKGNIVRVNTEEEKKVAIEKGAIWVEIVNQKDASVIEQVENIAVASWKDWVAEYVRCYGNNSELLKDVGYMILDKCSL